MNAVELLERALAREPLRLPPGRSSLREEVYSRLRLWIVEGLLPPETRLRDLDIAKVFGVSRTPVREALRRLQDEGLVVAEASRWTKVTAVDIGAAGRLYPIVWVLERLAVNLCTSWDDQRLASLRAANGRLAAALASHDASEAVRADTEFHRLVVGAAGNSDLTAIVEELKIRLRRIEIACFGQTATAANSVEGHERVIAALAAGDVDVAGGEIERNWRRSLQRLAEL